MGCPCINTWSTLTMAYSRKLGHAYSLSENWLKKGKKMLKKGKIFEKLGNNLKNLKIFLKRVGDCVRLLHTINC